MLSTMNEKLPILLFLIISISMLIFVIYLRKKPHIEKKQYAKINQLKFRDDVSKISSPLISLPKTVIKIQKCLEIDSNKFWIELYIMTKSGWQLIDAIFIKSDNFLYYRYLIQNPFVFFSRWHHSPIESSIAPKNIMQFLEKNNLSIDSGNWGLLLMKNTGFFTGSEIDEILCQIKNITYLTKNP